MLSIVITAKVPFESSHAWGRHFTHDLYSQTSIRLKITQFWQIQQIMMDFYREVNISQFWHLTFLPRWCVLRFLSAFVVHVGKKQLLYTSLRGKDHSHQTGSLCPKPYEISLFSLMKQTHSLFKVNGTDYSVPFMLIASLFFLWGFAHSILEVLNPHFQQSLAISKTKASSGRIWRLLPDGYSCRLYRTPMGISQGGAHRSAAIWLGGTALHPGLSNGIISLLHLLALCHRMRTHLSGDKC